MTGSKHESKARRAVHELREKIDEAGKKAEKLDLVQSLTKWLTIDTNEKLQERNQNHRTPQSVSHEF